MKTRKTVVIVMLLSIMLNLLSPLIVQAGGDKGETIRVITKMTAQQALNNYGGYPIKYYKDEAKSYTNLLCDLCGYYDGEKFYPAYCLNKELDGAEKFENGYDVVAQAYNNNYVYTVVRNGFGYKTASELGCESDYDAFVATKMAVYSVLYGYDLETKFKSTGTNRSDKIVSAIKNLVNKAYNETQSYKDPAVTLEKSGDIEEKKINEIDYYIQKYDVKSNYNYESYTLQLAGFPENTIVYNNDLSEIINKTTNVSSFYVCVPKASFTSSFKGAVNIKDVKCVSYPVLYGETRQAETQNYALVTDPYEFINKSATLSLELPDVEITKKERSTDTVLAGAEYDIINLETNEVVRHVGPTDKNGKIVIENLPVGKYQSRETKAPEGYNLDSDTPTFEVKLNGEKVIINSDDSVITSELEVTKLAKDDNEITGAKKGNPVKGALFNIYDINHKLLHENLATDEEGKINVVLRYGKYIVEEVRPPEFYLLNENKEANSQVIEVKSQGEFIPLTFENESVKLGLIIEKDGIIQCQRNDEIIYNFPNLKNDSNVSLDDFTWSDVLPTKYIRATKLYTGTYNEDLNYEIYYKTNLSGESFIQYKNEKTEDGKFNTLVNNYIDLTKINTEKEYVTEWKICFGTVKAGFEATEKPFMFAKVNDTVKDNDKWTNNTYLTGNYTSIDGQNIPLGSKDDWTTTSYSYSLSIKKLPKTGF